MDHPELPDFVKNAIEKTLKNLSSGRDRPKPLIIGDLEWYPECLTSQKQDELGEPKDQALKKVYSDILAIIEEVEPHYFRILRDQYWEGILTDEVANKLNRSRSAYFNDRAAAVSLFADYLWLAEQKCKSEAEANMVAVDPIEDPEEQEQPPTESINEGSGNKNELGLIVVLAVFLLLLVVGVIFWSGLGNGGGENTIVARTPSFTSTSTIFPSVTPLSTSTLSPTAASTPQADTTVVRITVVARVTQTPTTQPSATFTPFVSPTPTKIVGIVKEILIFREGPGTSFPRITRLRAREVVELLARNLTGSWLQIKSNDQIIGWVIALGIEAPSDILSELPVVVVEPVSLPVSVLATPTSQATSLPKIDIGGSPVSGQLAAGKDILYELEAEEATDTFILVTFTPNVNYYADSFIGHAVNFALYKSDSPDGPPANIAALNPAGEGRNDNRDGKLESGELIGGGKLEGRYYFHLFNDSSMPITYCLVVSKREIFDLSCSLQ